MIDTALATLLRQAAAIGPRVTPGTETSPVVKDTPRIAYTLLTDPRQYTDAGAVGLRAAQYQVDVFADLMTNARAISARITASATLSDPTKRGLDGFTGVVDQTYIRRIAFPDERPGQTVKIEGQDQQISRYMLTLHVWYRD